jgi:hypothetical protein
LARPHRTSSIFVEITGGVAMLLGALVPLASIPMAAVLMVAIFTVRPPYGFSSIRLQAVTAAGAQFRQPGFETDLLSFAPKRAPKAPAVNISDAKDRVDADDPLQFRYTAPRDVPMLPNALTMLASS